MHWTVALTVVLSALTVTLVIVAPIGPIGTGYADGASMASCPQLQLYVDEEPEVGDTILFRDHDGDVYHHRVVAETSQGYVTSGDLWNLTDQDDLGRAYARDENIIGVVKFRVELPMIDDGRSDEWDAPECGPIDV